MELTTSTLVTIIAVIGMLAIIVSVITEVTKDVVLLSKIPVNIQVIVLSQALTILAYFAYTSYSGEAIIWYYVIATVIVGFIVAYVVLFGWSKFAELYKRFRNIPPIEAFNDTISTTASDEPDTMNDNPLDSFDDIVVIDPSTSTTTSTTNTSKTTSVTDDNGLL